MVGNLEDFVRSLGNLRINFLEMDKTFYLDLKSKKKSHRYFGGRVMVISICMRMINQ